MYSKQFSLNLIGLAISQDVSIRILKVDMKPCGGGYLLVISYSVYIIYGEQMNLDNPDVKR